MWRAYLVKAKAIRGEGDRVALLNVSRVTCRI